MRGGAKTKTIFLFFSIFCIYTRAQKPGIKINWTAHPFEHKSFIQNEGQFNADAEKGDKVLYEAILGNVNAYFTLHGIIYRYDEYPKPKGEKKEDPDKDKTKASIHFLQSVWEGSNPDVTIEAKDEQTDYCTYPSASHGTIRANTFKKIIYKNLYKGVDAEYILPDGKEGIKYALIVHPGADISKIKLKYKGSKELKLDEDGTVLFNSDMGEFTDHTPVSYYKEDGGKVGVNYQVSGQEESFSVSGNYDKTKTLIIDPWTTDPLFNAGPDAAYDVDFDNAGNVYAYGAGGGTQPFQLVMLNNTGAIQWTYYASTFSNYYGDFAVDKTTGTSYIVEGFNGGNSGALALKVNNQGSLVSYFPGDTLIQEMWRVAYDPCQHAIVVGAGGHGSNRQAFMLDTNMNFINPLNVLSVRNGYHDMTLLSLDPANSTVCYMATSRSTGDNPSIDNNVLLKMPISSLIPTQYIVPDGYIFEEVTSINYYSSGTSNGMNGMAASPYWLYLYDGSTLGRFNKNTGANVTSLSLHAPSMGSDGQVLVDWGGLDVDACDNIYVGIEDSLAIYDSSMVRTATMLLPDTVYDLQLQGTNLYACGLGFVSSINVASVACVPPAQTLKLISSSPTYCSQPSITITAPANGTSYAWTGPCITGPSNQQTVSVTCAGTYSVVIGGIAGPPTCATTTLNITVPSGTGPVPVPSFFADTVCYGKSTQFTNTSNPLNGNGVKFYWDFYNTGSYEDSTANPIWSFPEPGKYMVKLHEVINGCGADTVIPVVVDTTPASSVMYFLVSCLGQPTNFTNYSADTSTVKYEWNFDDPASGPLDTTTTTDASHIYNTPGTYTVTLFPFHSIQCHDTAKGIVTVRALPTIQLQDNYVCGDSIITFKDIDSTGIVFCMWNIYDTYTMTSYSPASFGPSTTVSFPDSGSYTIILTAYNASFCSATDTMYLTLDKDKALFNANPLSGCAGTQVHFSDSSIGGPTSWNWNFGDPGSGPQNTSILQNPTHTFSTSGVFNVKLKISGVPGCIDSITRSITINPTPVVTVTPPSATVCVRDSVLLTAHGASTYQWMGIGLSCTNCIAPKSSPAGTTTYTVVGTSALGCTDTARETVTVVNKPVPQITGKDSICIGDSTQLTASGGTSYTWSTGSTATSIYAKTNVNTSYQVVVSNGFCKDSTQFAIVVVPHPVGIIIGPTKICFGDTLLLTASGGKTYLWSTGATTTSVKIPVNNVADSTYYVIVSNVCSDTTHTTVKIKPVLNITVCCDTTINPGDSVKLNAIGGINYAWLPTASLSCNTCSSPFADPSATTTYTVSTIDTTDGCVSSAFVKVNVEAPCTDFTVPNIFTPNGDGKNDQLVITAPWVTSYTIAIYNRWGQVVFYSTSPNISWDGRTDSGELANVGTYFYTINAGCQDKTFNKKGFVQLVR